ncbi:MAG TPA: restriction endonuclease [Blastocatellia bacterium]|nr:restriction endonuclease [Blastocatellia bacterium]
MARPARTKDYQEAIRRSGLTIYDPVVVGDPGLWIPAPELEQLLNAGLGGLDLARLPLRTRSKVVKQVVAKTLGYPIPTSFRKTQPRFPGQNFDTYVQKSNNLQIWNEEIAPTRRYVIIGVNASDRVTCVRAISGDTLSLLDTTGTLTQKYQARLTQGPTAVELVTRSDTDTLPFRRQTRERRRIIDSAPTDPPTMEALLPIQEVFDRLKPLVGETFRDSGILRERNRGGTLHELACRALGYAAYADNGQFPDIRHQLLEVKLQTSPTIDLGLVRPDSKELLDINQVGGEQIRHCDVRYAVFLGSTDGSTVTLSGLIITTGEGFFSRFSLFGGKVLNKKLQIRLPRSFFHV